MDRARTRRELLEFLRSIQRPDAPLLPDGVPDADEAEETERWEDAFVDDESLVEAGLIDSLAVMQIVTWLESQHGVDFAEDGLDVEELRSVRGILDVIERRAA
jgi:acyl carrier protein